MTTPVTDPAAALLFGKGRATLLALLFSRPDDSLYLREAARLAGSSPGTALRELRELEGVGLLTSRLRGNQRHYKANRGSPLFPALQTLLEQTMGVPDVLRSALAPIADQVVFAGIFGSLAQGTLRPASDVDVLVIGEVEFSEVADALAPTEVRLGRAVNPTVYSTGRFLELVGKRQPFITTVLAGPIATVFGELPGDPPGLVPERVAAAGARGQRRGRSAGRHR